MKITDAKAVAFSSVVGGGIALTTEAGKKFQIAFMGVNGGISKEETEELTALILPALLRTKDAGHKPGNS